jgi:beta-ribofuranosylaminobenzene 5'-phosphate synthase
MTRVDVGSRLHFGFGNLSLAHERLYGALGVALDQPRLSLEAEPAEGVTAPSRCEPLVEVACELLDLPGATVTIRDALPPHVGLGSGTQLALAIAVGVGESYGQSVDVRELAPQLGRGGRSGIGVATFEAGGFVLDGGHPTARFTTARPADGAWTVPPVAARHRIPDDWRFLIILPDADPGRSGETEDDSIRGVVERAAPAPADRIAGRIVRSVLPAIATGNADQFGSAVADIGRLNGTWYADEQGGVYRPPVGELVDSVADEPAVYGAGQSSWGPAVYGVTDRANAEAARVAGEAALDATGLDGEVLIAAGRNQGARVDGEPWSAE